MNDNTDLSQSADAAESAPPLAGNGGETYGVDVDGIRAAASRR
jgi:hypothetical protein